MSNILSGKCLKCSFSVRCLKMNTRTITKFLNSFIQFIRSLLFYQLSKWKKLKIEFARKCRWAELSWDESTLNWCISGIKVVMQGRKEGLSTIVIDKGQDLGWGLACSIHVGWYSLHSAKASNKYASARTRIMISISEPNHR